MTWLMFAIAQLSNKGAKYHDKKSDQCPKGTKEFAYHVYMLGLYTKIMELTIESHKLKEKYLKK